MSAEEHDESRPVVGIIMGSKSDWPTMEVAATILSELQIPHECKVVSAHRTPHWMAEYAGTAAERGIELIIAGAGGAAHLPGMVASFTRLPVIGVPVKSRALNGIDSLLSIVQMPGGVPVATMSIGTSGAKNAALLAGRIIANHNAEVRVAVEAYIENQTNSVLEEKELC